MVFKIFLFSLDKEEAAGCGEVSGSQPHRVRRSGYHHVRGEETMDV